MKNTIFVTCGCFLPACVANVKQRDWRQKSASFLLTCIYCYL